MSQIITQENRGRKSIYHRKTLNDAGIPIDDETFAIGVELRTVFHSKDETNSLITIKKGQHRGGQIVVCVIDENGILDEDVYDYINTLRIGTSLKTRKAMGYAIGTYKMFMRMNDYDAHKPIYSQIVEFQLFLLGKTVVPEPGHKVTYRSANTCNAYMSMTKQYLMDTHNDCTAFFSVSSVGPNRYVYRNSISHNNPRVFMNPHRVKRDPLADKDLPAHPKPDQVIRLLQMAKTDPVPAIYWCIYTQFRTGIRRGALLGLTREDICMEHNGDEVEYYIYLRNRVSDTDEDQYCKTLDHPLTEDEFRRSTGKKSIQRIHISERLYKGLIEYYESSRDDRKLTPKKRKRLLEATRADSIYGPTHANYYVFSHPNGNRLTGQTYDNHLKILYPKCGITVDKEFKKYNCSHQLRAAFIMYRARYSPHPESLLQVSRDAGHASPNSTLKYYNEFPEDINERWDQFDRELDELIPEDDNLQTN